MKVILSHKPSLTKNKAVLVSFFTPEKKPAHPYLKKLSQTDAAYIAKIMAHDFTTAQEKFREVHLPSNPDQLIVLANLGKTNEWNEKKYILFARKLVTYLKDHRIKSSSVFLNDFKFNPLPIRRITQLFAENVILADFTFNKYKEPPKEGWPEINEIEIIVPVPVSPSIKTGLEEGLIIGEETNNCRILANTPGGEMTPQKLAQAALEVGKKTGIKVDVFDEKKIKELGMGGILGVSKGSDEKPRFIVMKYDSGKPAPLGKKGLPNKVIQPIVFAGKGVTFDTGGLNLKPSEAIYEMHMDMSGGAAVIHAMAAIARMKLPVKIIGLIPAVENMPSGSSYHPGDILKTITGKTIEVLNTDAEGRIILADTLGYAQKLNPKLIVDAATLTGAATVALGQRAIALFSSSGEQGRTTNEKLEKFARDIGMNSGDYVWPLPLWDEYYDDVKGTFGDIANTGKKGQGGAIAGAIFLKQFVGNYPWMHLDIAPTMTTIEGQFLAKGASGTGVRFLVELAKNANKIP